MVAKAACLHERDEVKIGDSYILATESLVGWDKWKEPVPDIGVYLSKTSWDYKVESKIVTVKGKVTGFGQMPTIKQSYPTIIVDWTDMGALDDAVLDWLVNGIIKNMEQGKHVEVGCFGGHGRTGTLIACILGKIEGLGGKDAIETLRKRYCSKAVESVAQCKQVAKFLGSPVDEVDGLESKTYGYNSNWQSGWGAGGTVQSQGAWVKKGDKWVNTAEEKKKPYDFNGEVYDTLLKYIKTEQELITMFNQWDNKKKLEEK